MIRALQACILIAGAAALIFVTLSTPKVVYIQGSYLSAKMYKDEEQFPKIADLNTVAARSIAVIGTTGLLFFALKVIEKK